MATNTVILVESTLITYSGVVIMKLIRSTQERCAVLAMEEGSWMKKVKKKLAEAAERTVETLEKTVETLERTVKTAVI